MLQIKSKKKICPSNHKVYYSRKKNAMKCVIQRHLFTSLKESGETAFTIKVIRLIQIEFWGK